MKTSWAKGAPLEDSLQEQLRALIKNRGLGKTAELLEIGETTITKAAAGAGVRRVTAIAIESRLKAAA